MNSLENIYEYIANWVNTPHHPQLNERQQNVFDRMSFAYDQLKLESPTTVVNRIVKKFNVKPSTARMDIQKCQAIFSPQLIRTAEWLENFIIEDAMKQIKVAQELLDMKAWQTARADLIKIYAKKIDRKQKINPSDLGHNQYYITVNFGNKYIEKLDLLKLHEMPIAQKMKRIANYLYQDKDIQEITEIIES